MKIHFWKMQGLGNDFIIVDGIHQHIHVDSEIIKKLANRHYGIGFDQALILKKSENNIYYFQIYNSDGSTAEQCGNGIRCLAKFMVDNGLVAQNKFILANEWNQYPVEVLKQSIKVNMQSPVLEKEKIPFLGEIKNYQSLLHTEKGAFEITPISMGNPHCVLEVSNLESLDIEEIGKVLQLHPDFPQQANVSFVKILSPSKIQLKVYERGAGLTLACGSGACAAVAAARLWNKVDAKVEVMQAGGTLIVEWDGINHPLFMTGPAEKVFEGLVE
jgi:diaminopimelate epimerase